MTFFDRDKIVLEKVEAAYQQGFEDGARAENEKAHSSQTRDTPQSKQRFQAQQAEMTKLRAEIKRLRESEKSLQRSSDYYLHELVETRQLYEYPGCYDPPLCSSNLSEGEKELMKAAVWMIWRGSYKQDPACTQYVGEVGQKMKLQDDAARAVIRIAQNEVAETVGSSKIAAENGKTHALAEAKQPDKAEHNRAAQETPLQRLLARVYEQNRRQNHG